MTLCTRDLVLLETLIAPLSSTHARLQHGSLSDNHVALIYALTFFHYFVGRDLMDMSFSQSWSVESEVKVLAEMVSGCGLFLARRQ